MASNLQYELGTLVGGTWRQWSTAVGQDVYENLSTRATQYEIPGGWEDAATDTWAIDGSKSWPQWRNTRTGRIRRDNLNPPAPQTYPHKENVQPHFHPHITYPVEENAQMQPAAPQAYQAKENVQMQPAAPQTYLHKENVHTHLHLVERSPESHKYLYRRVMVALLRYFFREDEYFEIFQGESRREINRPDSRVDIAVLRIIHSSRPGPYRYDDYCLVESKGPDEDWDQTKNHLVRNCAGIEHRFRLVHGIVHIGLYVQFFTKKLEGTLVKLTPRLHIRNDVDMITSMFEVMKRQPPGSL